MATVVRIFRPAKNAMQSGRGTLGTWVLEVEASAPVANDGLMGWAGSADTAKQVRLKFSSREDAVNYAKRQGWTIRLAEPNERSIRPKSYAENFAFNRVS